MNNKTENTLRRWAFQQYLCDESYDALSGEETIISDQEIADIITGKNNDLLSELTPWETYEGIPTEVLIYEIAHLFNVFKDIYNHNLKRN